MRKQNLSVSHLTVDYIQGGGIDQFTKRFYLDPVNGSDGNDGKAITRAKKSWAAAYALLTTNKNEVLYLVGGASAVTVTEEIDWTKAYTNLVGLAAPTRFGNRNRINTTTADVVNTFHMSTAANGCIIANVNFSNEGDDVHNITAMKVESDRCYFENVVARVVGATAVASANKRDFILASDNGEHLFSNCCFGSDSYDGSGGIASYNFEFNGANQTARNVFEDCTFLGSGSNTAAFILATTVGCVTSYQLFRRCTFWNNDLGSMNVMAQAFNINASAGGIFIMEDCNIYGVTAAQTADSGLVWGRAVNAAATSNKLIQLTW